MREAARVATGGWSACSTVPAGRNGSNSRGTDAGPAHLSKIARRGSQY